jgi:hypothetical protein
MKFGDEPMFKECRNITCKELSKAISDSEEAYKKMEGTEYIKKSTKKPIKKPIRIKAVKIEKGMIIPNWFISEIMNGNIERINGLECAIKTLNGFRIAKEGDYVIKGIKGEVYPCKSDIFEASYEEVSE